MGRWLPALLIIVFACGDDDEVVDAAADSGVDAGQDAGQDAGEDAGPEDAGTDAEAPPVGTPYKRPWVQQVETTRALVRWETRTGIPSTIAIAVAAEDGGEERVFEGETARTDEITFEYNFPLLQEPDLPGTYHIHEALADGLEPATCYRYTLVDFEDFGGRFCTMHEATDHTTPIEFLAIGDTSAVLRSPAVLEQVLAEPVELVVHLGDLQYYDAVLESWQLFFRDMGPMLDVGGFFPCIGNHESELEGEFDATYARWFEAPSRDGDVHRYHYQTGGVHFFSVNSEDDIGEFDAMFDWLDGALDAAEATEGFRFSIVYFHRPIYTLARHAPSLSLRDVLEPIIDSHRVPLVLQGHNHVYERFQVGDVTYIVSGGGGSARYNANDSVDSFPEEVPLRLVNESIHHGVRFRVEQSTIEGRVIDVDGAERDHFVIDVSSL